MPDLPEFYVDQFRMGINPYGAITTFGVSSPNPATGQTQMTDTVMVRMSLEHLKVVALIIRKNLKAYEEQTGGQIHIPRAVLNQMGLSPEDW